MEDILIEFKLKINAGEYAGQTVPLITNIEELEADGLVQLMFDKGYLKVYCNKGEYEVVGRRLIHDEKKQFLLTQIAEITEKMRGFQKAFFKNKNTSDLRASKDYEQRVDKLISEYKELSNPQVKMFD